MRMMFAFVGVTPGISENSTLPLCCCWPALLRCLLTARDLPARFSPYYCGWS